MGLLTRHIVLESMERLATSHLEPSKWSDHDCVDSLRHNQQLREFRAECEARLTAANNKRIAVFKQEKGIT